MPHPRAPRPLLLEGLEGREVMSAAGLLTETFQQATATGLPAGWKQWSGDGGQAFAVDPGAGLGDTGRLASSGTSQTAARAWSAAPFDADTEASAAVFLNSAVPAQLFARGKDLDTQTPTYYAATVTRGVEVQLVRVVRGKTDVLGKVRSEEPLADKWVQVTLRTVGDDIQVYVFRGDTNQYLGPDGTWNRQPVAAVTREDVAVRGAGHVGFARPASAAGTVVLDSLRVSPADPDRATPIKEERFSRGPAAGLPPGWSQWVGTGGPVQFRTERDETLRVDGPSTGAARGWLSQSLPADVQISSSIYVDSLVPAGVLARGQNLDTARPTYYGLSVSRGLEVQLVRVVNGQETVLGTVRSKTWLSGQWLQTSLVVKGGEQRVQVYRADTGQYLSANGSWGLTPAWAMTRADTAIRGGGRGGLFRDPGYAGPLVFDNVIVTTAPPRLTNPTPIPTEQDKPTGPTPLPPEDKPSPTPAPGPGAEPPAPAPGNGGAKPSPAPAPAPAAGRPNVPRSYPWIRLANLAYHGTPMTDFEKGLLRNSIDLVVPNVMFLDTINAVAPDTPQMVYTNISNIYLGLYTDWLEYADRNGHGREAAFYHVTRATAFQGMSASAVPVNYFWAVHNGTTDVTRDARPNGQSLPLGGAGEAVSFGYPEKFREINFDLRSGAANGWAGKLEYVKAVDAQGRPTAWGTLATVSDSTNGLKTDGRITFDPPADWEPASVNGGAKLFHVRVRTEHGGTAPVAGTVLGRDYTNSRGQHGGTTPAFDHAADKDRNGYLSDAEYARRRPGHEARFVYESRLTYPQYGPHRYATNVADPAFRAWAGDYHRRFLQTTPLADGFFVDNSTGKLAVDPAGLKESLDGYAESYGSLLGQVNRSLGPKWLLANTSGAGTAAEPIVRNGVSYLEEFGIRPVSTNHVQYEDLTATLKYRRQLSGGKALEVLDSLLVGADAADPRAQVTTLAMYYTVADPDTSFLMMNGGDEPASGWRRHWTDAATYDVGRPKGDAKVFAAGTDPANRSLTYKVYAREYGDALTLYKPLSYTRGRAGTTAANTATTHPLDGWYRPVQADGSLGQPVNKVTLRNGEGLVLAKAR